MRLEKAGEVGASKEVGELSELALTTSLLAFALRSAFSSGRLLMCVIVDIVRRNERKGGGVERSERHEMTVVDRRLPTFPRVGVGWAHSYRCT